MFGRATIRLGIGPHSSFIFEVDSCKIHFKEMLISRNLRATEGIPNILDRQ